MIARQRAYARHRGVTHHAVQKAAAAGRITLLPDGRVDFDAADRQWKVNTLPGNGRASRRSRGLSWPGHGGLMLWP